MGPIHFPERSVSNYQYTLYNIPEKRKYHLNHGRSRKAYNTTQKPHRILIFLPNDLFPSGFLNKI
jgi:hypothetical protein